jgi:hypothetical protein
LLRVGPNWLGLASALTRSSRLPDATRVTNSITNWRRDHALIDIVDAHAAAGDIDAAQVIQAMIAGGARSVFAATRLATQLALAGQYEEARHIQRKLPDESDRIRALLAIAKALRRRSDNRADEAFAEAEKASAALDEESRAEAYSHLTRVLLDVNDTAGAGAAFQHVHPERVVGRDPQQYSAALRGLAAAAAAAADPNADRLITAAGQSIANLESAARSAELGLFVTALVDLGRFDDAWALLDSDRSDWQLGPTWSYLALGLAAHGDHDRSNEAFEQAEVFARNAYNGSPSDRELVELSAALAQANLYEKVEEMAALIEDASLRSGVLIRLAVGRSQVDPTGAREAFRLAEQAAQVEWVPSSRDRALSSAVSGLAKCEHFQEAFRVVAKIANASSRITALCELARCMIAAGDERGRSLFDEGLRIAAEEPDDASWYRWCEATQLRERAAQLEYEGSPHASTTWLKANDLAGSLWADWIWRGTQDRADALVGMAAVGQNPESDGTFALAHEAANAISYENSRSSTLLKLITTMITVGRTDLAEKVLPDLHSEHERRAGISELVKAHIDAGQPDFALEVASLEMSDFYRRELMRGVATAFAKANRMQDALLVIDEPTLDGFIAALSMALTAWTDPPPGGVLASIHEATRVAAWVRADWQVVHDGLSATSR